MQVQHADAIGQKPDVKLRADKLALCGRLRANGDYPLPRVLPGAYSWQVDFWKLVRTFGGYSLPHVLPVRVSGQGDEEVEVKVDARIHEQVTVRCSCPRSI